MRPKAPLEKAQENRLAGTLGARGIILHRTSERRYPTPCPKCRALVIPRAGMGQTQGLPDGLFRPLGWPAGIVAAVELKRDPDASIRLAQVDRMAEGFGVIAFSEEAAAQYAGVVKRLFAHLPPEAIAAYAAAVHAIPDLIAQGSEEARELERLRLRCPKSGRVRRPRRFRR